MGSFGPWDLAAFGGLYIGAFILAADTGLRIASEIPEKFGWLSKVIISPIWGFAPLALLTLSGVIFLGLQAGFIESRSNSGAAEREIEKLQSDLRLAREQITDLASQVRPRFNSLGQEQALRRELELPTGTEYSIIIQQDTGCGECSTYASNFETVFKFLKGWTISYELLFVPEISNIRGLTLICKKGELSPSGTVISKALADTEVKFKVLKIDNPILERSCVLYVGPREPGSF